MLDLIKAKAELSRLNGEIEKADEALSGENVENRDELETKAKALRGEFDALAAKVKEEKARAESAAARKAALDETEALEALRGKSIVTNGAPVNHASAKDPRREEIEKRDIFFDYVEGKSLGGVAMDALAPRNPKHRDESPNAVALPKSVMRGIIGGQYDGLFGKSILSVTDANSPSASSDSGADNLIAQDFRPQMIQTPVPVADIIDYVTMIPAVNGTAEFPQLTQSDSAENGGFTAAWTTEGAEKTEDKPTWNSFSVSTHELSALVKPSARMLRRSAVNLEAFLTSILRTAFRVKLADMLVNGNGSGQGYGVLQISGTETKNRAVANQVSYADLNSLVYGVRKQFRRGGRFLIEDAVEKYCMGLTDADGLPLFRAGTAGGPNDRLLGYAYDTSYEQPALGTKGDAIFGNWAYMYMAVEEDISIARSDHSDFDKGLVAFRALGYFGSNSPVPRAFCLLDAPTS